MELTSRTVSSVATLQYTGESSDLVVAGQSFKIETSPAGETILNEACPVGKKWTVKTTVVINEVDV